MIIRQLTLAEMRYKIDGVKDQIKIQRKYLVKLEREFIVSKKLLAEWRLSNGI